MFCNKESKNKTVQWNGKKYRFWCQMYLSSNPGMDSVSDQGQVTSPF